MDARRVSEEGGMQRWIKSGYAFVGRHKALLAKVALWYVLLVQARENGIGEVFMLLTGFFLIFTNLGKREEGSLSGYSVFNPGFRELPGTLNAARFENELRAGRGSESAWTPQPDAYTAGGEVQGEESNDEFDADLQEALKRSLQDLKRAEKAKKKAKKRAYGKRRT